MIVPPGRPAPTVVDVARDIIRTRGVPGLMRGIFPTAMRETGYGAYFGVYEGMLMLFSSLSSRRHHDHDSPKLAPEGVAFKAQHSTFEVMLAGGVAGVASWLVTFPFDVIKTRVQSVVSPSAEHPYRNMLSTIVNSYRDEGFRVFFHGLQPTLIRFVTYCKTVL
jgi:solute carrier family 25 (mitochondrial carnitine/acylcarnitine transporter), member 20/29